MIEQKWAKPSLRAKVDKRLDAVQSTADLMSVYEDLICPEFKKRGFDGFRYENEVEGKGTSYCVFSNTQIKLASPVAYDDNEEVIPLSKRFEAGEDIRGAVENGLAGKRRGIAPRPSNLTRTAGSR